jgi:hypothetical protein
MSVLAKFRGMTISSPRCNPGGCGVVSEMVFVPSGEVVQVCDQCEALWLEAAGEPHPHRFHDFGTWALEHGGTGLWTDLQPPAT